MMHSSRMYSELVAMGTQPFGSMVNTFSENSAEHSNVGDEMKQLTQNDGNEVVLQIVNDIFDRKRGAFSPTDSQCSIKGGFSKSEDMDKRLKHWQDTLRDRVKMQAKISRRVGRRPDEMLFNLPFTEEQRDRGTIQRLMDYATRLGPTKGKTPQFGMLPARVGMEPCTCVPPVPQTVPSPERLGQAVLEITGLSKATKNEILGTKRAKASQSSTKWLNSKALEEGLLNRAKDIKRVIDFYPDVDNLEVVGVNPLRIPQKPHSDDNNLLEAGSIYYISSSTHESYMDELEMAEEEDLSQLSPPEPEHINVGLKINDKTIILDEAQAVYNLDLQVDFECRPFERQVKQVMRLENVGRKIIACFWQKVDYHTRLLKLTGCSCFIFNHKHVKLFPGDVHIVNALFNPRMVCIGKQRWELKIFPNIFCTRRNTLSLQLVGRCVMPPEYAYKLDKQMRDVVVKSIDQVGRQLAKQQADLVPLLQPYERLCPYERAFDEREVFNSLNPGYHCDRFDAIEELRAQYNVLKFPREPPWDLRLETIKAFILRLPDVKNREIYFERFLAMQESLYCSTDAAFEHFDYNSERDRSRFVYVRGCIGNGIEEWEELMMSLEQSCFKSALIRFYARHPMWPEEDNEDASESDRDKPWLQQLKYDQPERYVLRKLWSKKHFRDSLYLHTYSHLCDLAENVVSVIESTEYI